MSFCNFIKRYWLPLIFLSILFVIAVLSTKCIATHAKNYTHLKSSFVASAKEPCMTKEEALQWINQVKMVNVKSVEDAKSELNAYIALWLSIVAAVCTLLPVAISFNAYKTFDEKTKDINDKFKKVDNGQQELEDKMTSSEVELQKKVDNAKKELDGPQMVQLMVMLRTMAEIPNRERPFLEEKDIVKTFIKEIKEKAPGLIKASKNSVINALCYIEQLKNLICTFENFEVNNPISLEEFQNAKYGLSKLADKIAAPSYPSQINQKDIDNLGVYFNHVLNHIEELWAKG